MRRDRGLQTNAVVGRRVTGRLREKGLVSSTGGWGGGWRLARPARAITARDVLLALERGAVFAIDRAATIMGRSNRPEGR